MKYSITHKSWIELIGGGVRSRDSLRAFRKLAIANGLPTPPQGLPDELADECESLPAWYTDWVDKQEDTP